jgi:hypothetical protein
MTWRRRVVETLRRTFGTYPPIAAPTFPATTQVQQLALHLHYRSLVAGGGPFPRFEETGFRIYSQMEEDGLLLYLFSLLGMGGRRCIEVAFGTPIGANTTNLICNWGWQGLLIEGDPAKAAASDAWFRSHPDTGIRPPTLISRWVESGTLDEICLSHGFTGDVDLLSIDMDGIDYWVWKRLVAARPRVVVVEVANVWGPDESFTVPDDARFTSKRELDFGFLGASLAAFAKLGREKGYRLVGVNRHGINAFFVRDDVASEHIPEVTVASCVDRPHAAAVRRDSTGRLHPDDWVPV